MNKQNRTPANDPLAKFREPPGEEGSDNTEELRRDRCDFDVDLPIYKPMSLEEIRRQLATEGRGDWDPSPDTAETYENERATFYEQKQQRLDAEALEAANPRFATLPARNAVEGLQKRQKPVCGARTRSGTPCKCKKLYNGGRCVLHGGLSTGPKTADGKARVALNLPKARCPGKRQ